MTTPRRRPPDPVVEDPPPQPDPSNIWIPGYWWWSGPLDRYVWVSGAWRLAPPGQVWIPGAWIAAEPGHYVRAPGYWAAPGSTPDNIGYNQAPPRERVEVHGAPPGPEYVWTRGYNDYRDGAYVWVGGSWGRPPAVGLGWVDARYIAVRGHYFFQPGRWDYGVERRGVVYAPDIRVTAGAHLTPVAVSASLVAAHAGYVAASARAVARGAVRTSSGGFTGGGSRGAVAARAGGHVGAPTAPRAARPSVAATPPAPLPRRTTIPAASPPATRPTPLRTSTPRPAPRPVAASPAPTPAAKPATKPLPVPKPPPPPPVPVVPRQAPAPARPRR